ncbi:Zinc finger CCCH domain-containing protein 14 [Platanthera guangdongensis]|uniref:Zinc finger CCCH domain-containing protein 14 n=1 Tax=Platanthera guangdongensis TaxID=2320717 RepID=A0ABR2N1F2_9ASPA
MDEGWVVGSEKSTTGCQFGEGCHFLHYVSGGYNAVAQKLGNPSLAPPPWRNPVGPTPPIANGLLSPVIKTRICNKFNTPEGCKFGEKCRFAHGERELGKQMGPTHHEPPVTPAATFGASATAKISVDASLAGVIIGKGGMNTKQICRLSGVKLAINEHESDQNLRNIELEGTFDQIKQASAMVRELIVNVSTLPAAVPTKTAGSLPFTAGGSGPGSNYKTKICEKFSKGSCTFGERCHFAHGASDLH